MTDAARFRALAGLIGEAERNGVLVPTEGLAGYSGARIVGALQRFVRRLADQPDRCYLEVGVYQGLTLVSAAVAAPEVPAWGIDNFAQFDPGGHNADRVERRIADNGATNAHLVNADYEDALEALEGHIGDRKVGVYFVDGPHDYRSQRMCLDLVRPFLAGDAVVVVDDSNYRHVRQANRDFLAVNPEYRLLYEAYTPCHPKNADAATLAAMRDGWWNGVNVLVRDPGDVLAREYPPTLRERTLYENEHVAHTARHGYVSAQATLAASAALSLRPWRALRHMGALLRRRRRAPNTLVGAYPALNTFSAELPGGRLNAAVASPEPDAAAESPAARGRR